MSLAGIRSNRGDAYQRAIATNYAIEMLFDENIISVQVEPITSSDKKEIKFGDDIVISYKSGEKEHIQAKINHKDHKEWNLTNETLVNEIIKAKNQLKSNNNINCRFMSCTSFGILERLLSESLAFGDYQSFFNTAPQNQQECLKKLSEIWKESDIESFRLIKRIRVGSHNTIEQWESLSIRILKDAVSKPEAVYELVYRFVDRAHCYRGESIKNSEIEKNQILITKEKIQNNLSSKGFHLFHNFNYSEIKNTFESFSKIGRSWVRNIGGNKIHRLENQVLLDSIDNSISTILLKDTAGGGKTCILLDLMDDIEKRSDLVPLFFKAELYTDISTISDFKKHDLPNKLIENCAYIASKNKLIIVIDSLDVLGNGRNHSALNCFLDLINHLSMIKNITIIVAARSFDIDYHPLLRHMKWNKTIAIKHLSIKNDVCPLLTKLGIEENNISETLKQTLTIPQNLNLFYRLVEHNSNIKNIEENNLFDIYLREIIENNSLLGKDVITKLQKTASEILNRRSYTFTYNSLNMDSNTINALLSQEVLIKINEHQLMFHHQSIVDSLIIKNAQQNNVHLNKFVTSQYQFPFIRSSVRSFILFLRSSEPDQFAKQIRELIIDKNVSTHIKRLAIETMASLSPTQNDLTIIKLLHSKYPKLFTRFLEKAKNKKWYIFLCHEWFPNTCLDKHSNEIGTILWFFSEFLGSNQEWTINLWNRALDEEWLEPSRIAWRISYDLRNNNNWDSELYYPLFQKLLNLNNEQNDNFGLCISKFIQDTNNGDELLWEYIIKDSEEFSSEQFIYDPKLNCKPYQFIENDFLEKRMLESDTLLNLSLNYLAEISQNSKIKPTSNKDFSSSLLSYTSWKIRRSKTDRTTFTKKSIEILIESIEAALKARAKENKFFWKKIEPELRNCKELGLRYMVCKSYLENIEENIDGISYQLTDKEIICSSSLDLELGQLSNKSHHYLSQDTSKKHQKIIISKLNNKDKRKFHYLLNIPVIYIEKEYINYLNQYRKEELFLPENTTVLFTENWIKSPISTENLNAISKQNLIRAFEYYNNYDELFSFDGYGGKEDFKRALTEASMHNPLKFIKALPHLLINSKFSGYVVSIILGIGRHILAQSNIINYRNFNPSLPLPDRQILANTLLKLLIKNQCVFNSDLDFAYMIQACACELEDTESLNAIILYLYKFNTIPVNNIIDDKNDLLTSGINTIQGIVIETALILISKKEKISHIKQNEIREILTKYATNKSMAVRAVLLAKLANVIAINEEFGWKLLLIIIDGADAKLLPYLEETLYRQYHNNFTAVKPYLELLSKQQDEKNAKSFGRLFALSHLSKHICRDEMLRVIKNSNKYVLSGIGEIFIHNITQKECSENCINGLYEILNYSDSNNLFINFKLKLSHKNSENIIPTELVHLFINKADITEIRELYEIYKWLEKRVQNEPESVLKIIELIISKFSNTNGDLYFHNEIALVSTLQELLKDADMTEDEEYINRVLYVMGWLINNGLSEAEKILEYNHT